MEYSNSLKKQITRSMYKQNLLERGLYLLLHKRYANMSEINNIQYDCRGKRTFLDIIQSKSGCTAKKPLFIYIHGGGWVSGFRQARKFYCRYWANKGYVCANIGYDYALDATHPEHIRQIFKGIAYVLQNAEEYGIDTGRVVIAGESAGGYFAALAAAVSTHKALYSLLDIPFAYADSFKIDACVLLSGIYDPVRALDTGFPDMELFTQAFCGMSAEELRKENGSSLQKRLSPFSYADAHFPPSFVIGSKKDLLLSESEALHDALNRAGVKNELYICTGINGVHAGGLACEIGTGKSAAQKAELFLQEVFTAKLTV